VLIAVSGCGSSTSTQGSSDPANVAPANTLAYASFDMAPTGPDKADFDAAFSKLLGADPETRLGEAFTKAVQTSSLSYADDVKPWLAGPVAVALTGVGQNSCDFALLMPSSDDGKAQAAIDKDLTGTGAQDRTYRDVAYKLQGDGTANGIVDHVVVAGTETAFKDVVDATKDGKSLAGSDQFKTTVGDRANGKVGLAYVDAKAVLQSVAANLPGVQRVAAPMLLGMLDLHPFVATLDAKPDSLIVDVASPGTKVDPNGPGAASSPLIESFPADSWLALAVPKAGAALGKLEAALKSNPLIGAEFANIAASVRAQTGIDLDKDVVASLGDVGMFVRGTTPATVAATLVTRPTRPGALANTMKRLPAVIVAKTRGRAKVTPQASGFDVAGPRGKRRLLVRTGVRAQTKLGNTALFRTAAALIGQRPTFFVNVGPALDLAAKAPRHKSDEHFKAALPRLRHVEYVAAGARRDAGLDVLRGVIGLR
jgi:Protein of unknown function (DUF3352)